jgi:bacillolysin
MGTPFMRIRFHVSDKSVEELQASEVHPTAIRGVKPLSGLSPIPLQFQNDEAAARYFCSKVFGMDSRPPIRGLTAPDRPDVMPTLELDRVKQEGLIGTSLVSFHQTESHIRVFGTRITVELNAKRELLSVAGEVADVKTVPSLASVSTLQALESVASFVGEHAKDLEKQIPSHEPKKFYFHDDKAVLWRLVYLFEKVPAAPRVSSEGSGSPNQGSLGHGLGLSPRELSPRFNYLVDAHTAEVVFWYSSTPMVSLTKCKGIDESGASKEFFGSIVGANVGYEMRDSLRAIVTHDLRGKDFLAAGVPADPCRNELGDWRDTNTAAVSAHINAVKVYDFYKTVLMRDGIDDKGMDLVSVVNCVYLADGPGPEWRNAVWYDGRMWYGQVRDGNGVLRSFARHLDVIGHELTHGVTETTANLVYKYQSGALNESFSDIFGVVIANWDPTAPDKDVSGWEWSIGNGLGAGGRPLRDLRDPKVTRDPDHMKDYSRTEADNGGVHRNSNIHNKAAYNVLTATDLSGKYIFKVRDVAILYYLALHKLGSLADFAGALSALEDAALTFFAGDAQDAKDRAAVIRGAYAAVGIV